MNTVLAQRVAWRRRTTRHHYVGTLSGLAGGIRLAGREPGTGIEVGLFLPFEEIESVSAGAADEKLVGESCVVLELSDSEPILVRNVDVGELRPKELAARIAAHVTRGRQSEMLAAASS